MVDEVENVENVEAESQDNTSDELTLNSLDDLRNLNLSEEVPAESEEPVEGDQIEPEAPTEEDVVEYTPDFTYKVKDEVLEFDEGIRSAITSKEVEDKFRDLYTRAAGLDGYKEKYSDMENKYNEAQPQLERMIGGYKNLMTFRDNKDFDRLLSVLGVSEEDLLDHAEKLLERQELPEEQRQAITANREMTDKIDHLERQITGFQANEQSAKLDAERGELQSLLSSEQYAGAVETLNEVGLNFESEVIKAGDSIVANENRYPTVAEAVAKAYELRLPLIDRLKGQPEQTQQPPEETVVERKPTLPKVKGANNTKVDEVMTFAKLKELQSQIPTG